jgi:hypothetical protein
MELVKIQGFVGDEERRSFEVVGKRNLLSRMMGCGWRIGPLPSGRSSLVRRTIVVQYEKYENLGW